MWRLQVRSEHQMPCGHTIPVWKYQAATCERCADTLRNFNAGDLNGLKYSSMIGMIGMIGMMMRMRMRMMMTILILFALAGHSVWNVEITERHTRPGSCLLVRTKKIVFGDFLSVVFMDVAIQYCLFASSHSFISVESQFTWVLGPCKKLSKART